ncbi:MAG: galactose-1-phosphate uridylyltransferase [Chloroflexota bacterium]
MSEIRQDPTTKEWVIIATDRAKRPSDFMRRESVPDRPDFSSSCPFCPGNEAQTPPETLVYRDGDSGKWRVRVFPNKFPALSPKGDTLRREQVSIFLGMDGVGIHEVIVESPLHNRDHALMEDSEVQDTLCAYRERYNAISHLPFVRLIIIFKNHGALAGTSLLHPHSQLVAAPVVPRYIRMQYEVAIRYYDDTGRCLYSDLVHRELEIGKRIVMETGKFVVYHPFASHSPFETWIVPKVHRAAFAMTSADEIEDLAHVLRVILLKLHRGLNNPDFNYVIDTAPVGDENKDYYLWHMRIIPRLSERAGFEIGSGIYINTSLPEETAAFMRDLPVA